MLVVMMMIMMNRYFFLTPLNIKQTSYHYVLSQLLKLKKQRPAVTFSTETIDHKKHYRRTRLLNQNGPNFGAFGNVGTDACCN